jgi:hypothetical protein
MLMSSLLVMLLRMDIERTKMLIIMTRNSVDRGLVIPINEPNSFIRSPTNIRKEILNPTENKIVSVIEDLSNPDTLKSMKPGTNIRKRKPMICRVIGISRTSVIHHMICIASMYIMNLDDFKPFISI